MNGWQKKITIWVCRRFLPRSMPEKCLAVRLQLGRAMRDFVQSCTTLAFSISLLGLELVDDVTFMDSHEFRGAATRAVDSVSKAALDHVGPRLRFTFNALNDIQRGVVGIMFDTSVAMARAVVNRLSDGSHSDRHGRRYVIDDSSIHRGSGPGLHGNYGGLGSH